MASQAEIDHLIKRFPELAGPDVLFEKEVYAHFGLLCFHFGLFEHSLINAVTFSEAIAAAKKARVRTQAQWEPIFDREFHKATKQTFGNLIRQAKSIPEFSELKRQFDELKELRDYFIHHFWRRETRFMSSEQGCWQLLVEMNRVREKFESADRSTHEMHEALLRRMGFPSLSPEQIEVNIKSIQEDAQTEIAEGAFLHGIDRWRTPEQD